MLRNPFALLVFCAVVVGFSGCNQTQQEDPAGLSIEGSETRIYEVFGMNCPGCHEGVEKLVKRLPGVIDAQANWKEKRITIRVKSNAELKDEDVFSAIKRANFTPGKRLQ
ncbi:MAG: cation transporter [Planctomycetota bacterium]|jgi:copper chaperone CopZ